MRMLPHFCSALRFRNRGLLSFEVHGRSDQDAGQKAIRVLKALRLAAIAPSLGGGDNPQNCFVPLTRLCRTRNPSYNSSSFISRRPDSDRACTSRYQRWADSREVISLCETRSTCKASWLLALQVLDWSTQMTSGLTSKRLLMGSLASYKTLFVIGTWDFVLIHFFIVGTIK